MNRAITRGLNLTPDIISLPAAGALDEPFQLAVYDQ